MDRAQVLSRVVRIVDHYVFNEEISSFQFGTWPSEEFFLLTVAHEPNERGHVRRLG